MTGGSSEPPGVGERQLRSQMDQEAASQTALPGVVNDPGKFLAVMLAEREWVAQYSTRRLYGQTAEKKCQNVTERLPLCDGITGDFLNTFL